MKDSSPAPPPAPPPAASRWRVREALTADEPALLALFQRAFGSAMPPALWRWKYARPQSRATLVENETGVVAYYGGVARSVLFMGAPATAVQIGDVMVDPAWRGVLTRQGPFYRAATGFIERWMGEAERRYDFAFGFPSDRACRLGVALRLYEAMDRIQEVEWASAGSGAAAPRGRLLTARDAPLVDRLWQAMARDLGECAVGVRDGAYVCERYIEHPVHRYTVFLVTRRFLPPLGVVVLRDHGEQGEQGAELMDLIGKTRHLPALAQAACQLARQLGRRRLFAWATPAVVRHLAVAAAQVRDTEVVVPTIVWQQPERVRALKDRWWLMGGDTDFR
ncbi:MAG: GNAT family N-acetyltransferase [Betaproteobacteria bacterium]|nr:GNAT family N-acetyltransferase [Betaproteobacteria bacterium]